MINKNSYLEVTYFHWLCQKVMPADTEDKYSKLLETLFSTPFIPAMRMDTNRWADGIDLRWDFADEFDLPDDDEWYLNESDCTILEMMIALSIRCEYIMSDLENDNTGYWFFEMLRSLGVYWMTNENFSRPEVDQILSDFNQKKYEPNGSGGLYTVPNYIGDIRDLEIWDQMHLYLRDID